MKRPGMRTVELDLFALGDAFLLEEVEDVLPVVTLELDHLKEIMTKERDHQPQRYIFPLHHEREQQGARQRRARDSAPGQALGRRRRCRCSRRLS